MKYAKYPVLLAFLLFACAVPIQASESENTGWASAYESYILGGDYLTSAVPEYYKDDPDSIRFGLYDLDMDGFPELVAYNGCPYMAGACNYIFTCRNGQISYAGDAGYRGSVLQYYPTSDYHGLFCNDGNMGFFITTYYEMAEGQILPETVMEQDYNAMTEDGNPTVNQVTEDTGLFLVPQTKNPVTLQMFTASEIRAMGWQELISRYPFVSESASAGKSPASADSDASQSAPAADTTSQRPFYGVWFGASKAQADMETLADTLRQYGYDAHVLVTADWDNLNPEMWYVVTSGLYVSEAEAYAALSSVQVYYPDAYVKYSGEYIGG